MSGGTIRRFVLFFILAVMVMPIVAQPNQINAALADLSSRVGVNLQINNLQRWFWSQELYPDTAMGCPAANPNPLQQQTIGYTFDLVYNNVLYSYRVSSDSNIVLLCETRDLDEEPSADATGTPEGMTPELAAFLAENYSNTLCPVPEEDALPYMRSRIAVGLQARVVQGQIAEIKSVASVNGTTVGELPSGFITDIQTGPICEDERVWWQVNANGIIGWVAEGTAGIYYLEPTPPVPLPTRSVITRENAQLLQEVSLIEANVIPQVAWSADNQTIAVAGDVGNDSVWLYEGNALSQSPRIIPENRSFTTMAYHPIVSDLLLGTASGNAVILDTSPNAPVVQKLFLKTHERDNSAVAWHPDGTRFGIAGFNANTDQNVDKQYAILVWQVADVSQVAVLPGHTNTVLQMSFNMNGSRLGSVSEDNSLIIWDIANQQLLGQVAIDGGARSIAYSPNGQYNAIGNGTGFITLFELSTGQAIQTFSGHGGMVYDLAFSPDSTLLASAGADGTVRVWDVQSGNLITSLQGEGAEFRDVTFSPDSTVIAGAGADHKVRFWALPLQG